LLELSAIHHHFIVLVVFPLLPRADSLGTAPVSKMGLLLRVVSAPVWFMAIALFASSFIWLRLCMVFASAVHFVLDVASGGALARNLEEWMVGL